jgi:hypothetical protein
MGSVEPTTVGFLQRRRCSRDRMSEPREWIDLRVDKTV